MPIHTERTTFLSPKEAAKILKVSIEGLRFLTNAGRIRAFETTDRRRFYDEAHVRDVARQRAMSSSRHRAKVVA
jgi:DNA-binding transcriptional MerR regulator